MTKIRIKPKLRQVDIINPVERERQEDCCDEIGKLRCEMEMMKSEMAEMKQYLREIQKKEEIRRITDGGEVEVGGIGGNNSSSDFSEWINGMEMVPEDLEKMFQSKDIIDWACHFIMDDLIKKKMNPYPICSIKGSKNEILVYDSKRWRKISDNELFTKLTDKLFKKILKIFTQWKNDNYSRILTSEHFATMYHSNYARILSFNENFSKLKLKLFHVLENQI
jgi:Txe/YoeB family toxin of Txe-Axe toxin-antitoxin module